MTNNEELRKRIKALYNPYLEAHNGRNNTCPCCVYDEAKEAFERFLQSEIEQAEKATAQQCYLECLAVGCGETEYSEAINSKFNLKN